LKDKKVRILVGLEVDPLLVSEITQYAKDGDEDLSRWQPRRPTTSRTALKLNYIDSFVGFMNDSDIFDDDKTKTDTFIDGFNQRDIDWKNDTEPPYQRDRLESVIIESPSGKETYYRQRNIDGWNPSTIDKRHTQQILDIASEIYNQNRAEIRETLRSQFETQHKPLEEMFK